MKLKYIEVRQISIERRLPFLSARAKVHKRRIILVKVADAEGRVGWGECSAPEEPRYCEEWTDSAWKAVNTLFAPLLLAQKDFGAPEVRSLLDEFRGNRMAKAALETACWDLEARRSDIPLWELLGGTGDPIPCGVAIGITNSIDQLLESIEREITAGYRRIKLKIRPGWDLAVVKAARTVFPDATLMIDANGAYRFQDFRIFEELDSLGLLMMEQPFAPDDLWAYHRASESLITPICLDETIVSTASLTAAAHLHLCDVVNVKLGRVGGHSEAKEIVGFCREHPIPCWCGGQHEAGIARAHNLALASLMPRNIPAELSASQRYWHTDIITPEITVDSKGFLLPPSGSGFGFDLNSDLISSASTRVSTHR